MFNLERPGTRLEDQPRCTGLRNFIQEKLNTRKEYLNMPSPRPGESERRYMSRCIRYVEKEEPGKKHMYYVMKCKALWEKFSGKKK